MASILKNVASQNMPFATVSSTAGTISTSTSTTLFSGIWVCKDGSVTATSGAGSIASVNSSGGGGQWVYQPTQSETNCTNMGVLLVGTAIIPVHMSVWTDVVDANGFKSVNVADFGAVAVTGRDIGASVLLSSGTGTGQLDIIAGIAQVNTIQFQGTTVTSRDIGASVLLSSGTGTGQLNLSSGNVTVASILATAGSSVADQILDRDMSVGVDSGSSSVRTPRQAMRVLRNKVDVSSGTTLIVYKEDDATQSWTAAVTVSSAAQPIVTLTPP